MRGLFWLMQILFVLGLVLSVGWYVTPVPPGGGMVMIFFLPIAVGTLCFGASAAAIYYFCRQRLSLTERRIGLGMSIVLVAAAATLATMLALE